MAAVPFTVPVFGGLAAAEGLVRLEGDELVLEFLVQDQLVGLLKSGVKEIRIPVGELEAVTLKRGWFETTLTLRTSNLRTLLEAPGSQQGSATLQIARKDRPAAQALAHELARRLGGVVAIEAWTARRVAALGLWTICGLSAIALAVVALILLTGLEPRAFAARPLAVPDATIESVGDDSALPDSEPLVLAAAQDTGSTPLRREPLPDWVRNRRLNEDDPLAPPDAARFVVVSSSQYATVSEAEQDVLARAVERVKSDIERADRHKGEWTLPVDRLPLRRRYVEELVRGTDNVSFRVYRVHRELELSPAVRRELARLRDSRITERRLRGAAWMLALLAVTCGAGASWLQWRAVSRTD